MEDSLSRKPQANAISFAYNHDLTSMIEKYAMDEYFAKIYDDMVHGRSNEPFLLKEGFILSWP